MSVQPRQLLVAASGIRMPSQRDDRQWADTVEPYAGLELTSVEIARLAPTFPLTGAPGGWPEQQEAVR